MSRRRKKKNSIGRIFSLILFLISLGVFIFAGYKLYTIFHEYNKGDTVYEDLQDFTDDKGEDGKSKEDSFYVDFDKLRKKNKDLVAWIRIGKPIDISYPVMQSKDNNFYLRRLFNKTHNILGSIFIDANCNANLKDQNTIIYGHNTKNGSMFGGLKIWKEKKKFKKNPYFYLYTPDYKVHVYKVCAITVTDAESEEYKIGFEDDQDFLNWLTTIQNNSLYDTGTELNVDSKIVTLSTCTNRVEEERLVVHGVEVEVRECKKNAK